MARVSKDCIACNEDVAGLKEAGTVVVGVEGLEVELWRFFPDDQVAAQRSLPAMKESQGLKEFYP